MKTLQISKFILFAAIACLSFTTVKSQEKQEDKITAATNGIEGFR